MRRQGTWLERSISRGAGARAAIFLLAAGLAGVIGVPLPARGFTQKCKGLLPIGHEWITRIAALEVLGENPLPTVDWDSGDPRKHDPAWTGARATNIKLDGAGAEVQRIKVPFNDEEYSSNYRAVYSAIMGQRWVDLAGFNITKERLRGAYSVDCWDAVDQQPEAVQYDHYLRRSDDAGGEGGLRAGRRARDRFVRYFIAAAMAPQGDITFYDGGASSEKRTADRNYFLFGRAVHVFEDSFSPEHTIRVSDDGYKTLKQLKSYLCSGGSEQHNHDKPLHTKYETHRDIIWKASSWTNFALTSPFDGTYRPSGMTDIAIVATEATKDLWAAFIRTMARPANEREAAARSEALAVADAWLRIDEQEARNWYNSGNHRGETYVRVPEEGEGAGGMSVDQCVAKYELHKSGKRETLTEEIYQNHTTCLYNVEKAGSGERDPYLHMPYSWEWSNNVTRLLNTPGEWRIPDETQDEEGGEPVDMAEWNDRLWVAFVDESHRIWITSRPLSGSTWTPPYRVVNWESAGAPALAATTNGLLLVHRGTDNRIYAGFGNQGSELREGELKWGNAAAASAAIATHHRPTLNVVGPDKVEMLYRGSDWRLYFVEISMEIKHGTNEFRWAEKPRKLEPASNTVKTVLGIDLEFTRKIVDHRAIATPDVTTLKGHKYMAMVTRDKRFVVGSLDGYRLKDARRIASNYSGKEVLWTTSSPPAIVGVEQNGSLYLAHRGEDDLIYWAAIKPTDKVTNVQMTTFRTFEAPVLLRSAAGVHLVHRGTDGKLYEATIDPQNNTVGNASALPDPPR